MSETPFFFPGDGVSLFGVLHEPVVPVAAKTPFVFCHPFGEEKLWTHRSWVSFARQLTARGHVVLRFDLRGNGDSSGDFSDSSLQTALSDTRTAIETVKHTTGAASVTLLGLRLGGSVAALIADERDDVDRLLLWSPIIDGHRFVQELLRVNLATQMTVYKEVREDRAALVALMKQGRTVNVDGYPLSLAFYEQLAALKLAHGPRAFSGPCLVVQIDRAEGTAPLPEVSNLASCYGNATHLVVREEPFWKEIERFYEEAPTLASTTLGWLEGR